MARNFVGASSQYLEHAAAVLAGAPVTVAFWFKTSASGNGAAFTIGVAAGSHRLQAQINGSGDAEANKVLWAAVAASSSFARTTATYTSGVWSHFCGVEAASNDRRVYLNGANKVTDAGSVTPSGLDVTDFGTRYSGGTRGLFYTGDLAECGVWKVALTDDEVALLGKGFAPRSVRPGALVAYWPLVGRTSPEVDLRGGFGMTVNGPTAADHVGIRVLAMPPGGMDVVSYLAAAAAGARESTWRGVGRGLARGAR